MLVVAAHAQNQGGLVESYTLPPDQLQRAIEYARARQILYFAGTTWNFVVLGLVLALKLGPRYRTWAEAAATQNRFLQVLAQCSQSSYSGDVYIECLPKIVSKWLQPV